MDPRDRPVFDRTDFGLRILEEDLFGDCEDTPDWAQIDVEDLEEWLEREFG